MNPETAYVLRLLLAMQARERASTGAQRFVTVVDAKGREVARVAVQERA